MKDATKNLDYICHSVMADLKEVGTKNYPYYLKWAIDCFRELNLFVLPVVKTVILPVGPNNTIDLPGDFVKYTAIGVNIRGHLWLLGLNNSMVPNTIEECPVPITDVVANPTLTYADIYPYYYFFSGMFRGGQYVGEQYARGGGWSSRGYYMINEERRQIQFQGVVPQTEIVLEYKSTGVNCDGTVCIPYETVSAHLAFVHWQRVEHDQSLSVNTRLAEAPRKERLWIKEFNKLKHYKLAFTMQEFLDNRYRTSRQTPKR